MDKERYNQIIDDAYKNYIKWDNEHSKTHLYEPYTQEQFINECKTDKEFSQKWGLLIEERELGAVERMEYYGKHYMKENETKSYDELLKVDYDGLNIPKRAVSIKYNNETIEVYE